MSARLEPRGAPALHPVWRPLSTSDLPRVLPVEARAYSHPWSRGNFIDSLAAGYHAALLLDDDTLLGYYVAMAGVDELHLLNLTVAPEHQGQGLGHTLMDAVEALAQRLALPRVLLEVRPSNARARALYARRGFAEIGRRRGYYPAAAGREDALVLALALPEAGGPDALE
jgi:[ribosomal protein S18]-alanine N-acetyltransferase